jgi:cytochrome c-type biogenesis protein CcmH
MRPSPRPRARRRRAVPPETDAAGAPAPSPAPAPAATPTGRRSWLRWLPWVGLIVVVAVALTVGSQRHSHPTLAQRTTSIASAVRCPVCSGETAAESDTQISGEIRTQIHAWLVEGESRPTILGRLEAAYGPSILERPPARGINLLLWIGPVVAVAFAALGLAFAFSRWRPAHRGGASDEDRRIVGGALGDGADAS